MVNKKTPQLDAESIRKKIVEAQKHTPMQVQKVTAYEAPKKIGRKSHFPEGVAFERLGVKVPTELKDQMVVAMKTTHKEYKTMDLFVAEAMRVFLAIKR